MMPLPLAPRRLLALALAVAGCWAGAASAAPLRVETRLSDAFSAVWERETVDGFSYTMLQAEADLSAASLEIQAAMVGKALLEADALERVAGFRDAFLVAGTDGFTSAPLASAFADPGLPNGPLAREGRWLASPAGLASAVGFLPGNRPVFYSNWIAGQPRVLLRLEILAKTGERFAAAHWNRPVPANSLSIWTAEYALGGWLKPDSPDAFLVALDSIGALERSADGWLAETYRVFRAARGDQGLSIGGGMIALCGRGLGAQWLEAYLSPGAIVEVRRWVLPAFEGVKTAIGLGPPLIWDGVPAVGGLLDEGAATRWGGLDDPSRATLAYFPGENKLRFYWSEALARPGQAIARRFLIGRLLEAGAQYAFEFGYEGVQPALYVNRRPAMNAPSQPAPRAPAALWIGPAPANDRNRLVNLCRAGRVRAQAIAQGPTPNTPDKLVDGLSGLSMRMDHFWMAQAPERSREPIWAEIDLGATALVSRIEIVHAEAIGFSWHFNTADFTVAGRQGTSGFWSPLAKIENNRQERTWIELPRPAPLRQIRLEITRPNHFVGNPIARVAEIAIWGKAQK